MLGIRIYTNLVAQGWSASDLETGIGGSEEKLIEWAKYAVKQGHSVIIYHNGQHGEFDGVQYRDHKEFRPWVHSDVFISFKARHMLEQSVNATKILHWTTDIESWSQPQLDGVDQVLTISKYHTSRMQPRPHDKISPLYLWADYDRLDKNKTEQEVGSMLYSSSYDRGLEELLVNWDKVKEKLKLEKLYLTYGWDFLDQAIKSDPNRVLWKKNMVKLMDREDIIQLGRISFDQMCEMYWKAQYWVMPINNPDGELFCINALKAQYCGAIPVVRRLGGMQETVNNFIDWDGLFDSKTAQSKFGQDGLSENKEHAVKFNLEDIFKQWEKIMID